MSSPYIAPEASFSEQSHSAMQNQLGGLGGLNGQNMTPEAKAKKLREACEGFESIFIQKMWQEMRNAVPKGGLLQGREERFWQDMYDQELAKSMTKAGGIGLADMMYEQLSANLGDASKIAAGRGTGSAFTPEAAPLLAQAPQAAASILDPEEEPAPVDMSIYEGAAPETAEVAEAIADSPLVQAPVAPPQPVHRDAPIEAAKPAKPARKRPERVKKTGHEGDSALNLAYLARREAGDKLGSRAVRPALQPRKARHEEATPDVAAQAAVAAAPNPGSEASLRSAVEMARSGSAGEAISASRSMQDLVTSVKLENARLAAEARSVETTEQAVASVEAPKTTRVTVTTNIPRNPKSQKNRKNGEPIRMLNVDNLSANSNAGKGLAAYHAAQEQSNAAPRPAVQPTGAAAPIEPLTVAENESHPSFAIPPLTGAEAGK